MHPALALAQKVGVFCYLPRRAAIEQMTGCNVWENSSQPEKFNVAAENLF
jgi:hypothetical protein